MNITTVGIDLAKSVFQVHGVDARGKPALKKQLRRDQVAAFFANQPPCLVGMEAIGTAMYERRLSERSVAKCSSHGPRTSILSVCAAAARPYRLARNLRSNQDRATPTAR